MKETWKPVPITEFSRIYEVSSLGRVRRRRDSGRFKAGFILKNRPSNRRYPIVRLSRPGGGQTVTVHRLVALAFLGPRPPGHQINHIDHNPANPAANNLEWVTPMENTIHKVRAQRHRAPKGEAHGNARLTEKEVRRILGSPKPVRAIAKQFGVAVSTVYDIKRRVTWTHVHVDDFQPLKRGCNAGRRWADRQRQTVFRPHHEGGR